MIIPPMKPSTSQLMVCDYISSICFAFFAEYVEGLFDITHSRDLSEREEEHVILESFKKFLKECQGQ